MTHAAGMHYCLGARLARLEAGIAIDALIRRFSDIRVAVPIDQLQWQLSLTLRGLVALPLRLA
jgi:cytochrome P450